MAENSGSLLPVYMVADESFSMSDYIGNLNEGLAQLHDALLGEPMAAAKVRFTILGFSDDVQLRLAMADLRRENELPQLEARNGTAYGKVFEDLRARLPADVASLKGQGYVVHRPAVFFLSDGQPTDGNGWRKTRDQLVDQNVTKAAPNIIACGIGDVKPQTMLDVATKQEYAFVSTGSDLGAEIAKFCAALTKSIVKSGRTIGSAQPELVVERPQNFKMAIDVV
ncbi:vWA domain-containing protein [Micromonospora sp. LZ34]